MSSVNYKVEGVADTRRRRKTLNIVHVIRMSPTTTPKSQKDIYQGHEEDSSPQGYRLPPQLFSISEVSEMEEAPQTPNGSHHQLKNVDIWSYQRNSQRQCLLLEQQIDQNDPTEEDDDMTSDQVSHNYRLLLSIGNTKVSWIDYLPVRGTDGIAQGERDEFDANSQTDHLVNFDRQNGLRICVSKIIS
ncbi:hypothetical protein LAZ67_X000530 [Cordylochernes scorpioides]|uniref:Uncharacterized protein n=1 Tax=Cordylochernes scorpioides TaxID=51811 RepID=A0ABY6LSR8_9ARAC|nr:hypothetical protein LAZ67_X000530 [Cordylochernes scorpioides]